MKIYEALITWSNQADQFISYKQISRIGNIYSVNGPYITPFIKRVSLEDI